MPSGLKLPFAFALLTTSVLRLAASAGKLFAYAAQRSLSYLEGGTTRMIGEPPRIPCRDRRSGLVRRKPPVPRVPGPAHGLGDDGATRRLDRHLRIGAAMLGERLIDQQPFQICGHAQDPLLGVGKLLLQNPVVVTRDRATRTGCQCQS